jgi:hypothetical protein
VLLGIMLNDAARPPLQSLLEGPSTVFWVAESQNIATEDHYNNQPHITIIIKMRPQNDDYMANNSPVMEWTVVMRPSTIPNLSLITCT